ncbi:MAG: D-alanyl-D-alanine carboxypeptidase family protein [Oscillospiraceae bacterium]|nr:D-alanyl-D-alanine carboxypeptidase family protein [Oscillospiraceae bacterium]
MDGKVTAADARYILRLSINLDDGLDAEQQKKADFDEKDGITAADARYALRVSVGMDPYQPTLAPGYTFAGYTSKGYALAKKDGVTYVVSSYGYTLIANKTYSLPSTYAPGDLTSECKAALGALQKGASKEGMSIYCVSGYRSYQTQANLYNRYVARDGKIKADTYSARPGHSEHQSGLALDVNSVAGSFANTREGRWLAANAHKYGFIIRYGKDKQNITGYIYEPWHIRYVGAELAAAVYESGLCLEEFFGITSAYN